MFLKNLFSTFIKMHLIPIQDFSQKYARNKKDFFLTEFFSLIIGPGLKFSDEFDVCFNVHLQ